MAREKLVIGGYTVPGGWGGIMVRRACELVLESPGIRQKDLLTHSCLYANLNLGTAGWLVSPGPKSPACILWDRRDPNKGRGFECFPNELTELCTGASAEAQKLWVSHTRKGIERNADLAAGSLCRLRDFDSSGSPRETYASFHGWRHSEGSVTHSDLGELLDLSKPYKQGYIQPVFMTTEGEMSWYSAIVFFRSGGAASLEVVSDV